MSIKLVGVNKIKINNEGVIELYHKRDECVAVLNGNKISNLIVNDIGVKFVYNNSCIILIVAYAMKARLSIYEKLYRRYKGTYYL